VNECTAQLADSMETVGFGTAWLVSCSYLLRSVCGTSPLSAQCSATVFRVHSDIDSLCMQNWVQQFFLFITTKPWESRTEGERI